MSTTPAKRAYNAAYYQGHKDALRASNNAYSADHEGEVSK